MRAVVLYRDVGVTAKRPAYAHENSLQFFCSVGMLQLYVSN